MPKALKSTLSEVSELASSFFSLYSFFVHSLCLTGYICDAIDSGYAYCFERLGVPCEVETNVRIAMDKLNTQDSNNQLIRDRVDHLSKDNFWNTVKTIMSHLDSNSHSDIDQVWCVKATLYHMKRQGNR